MLTHGEMIVEAVQQCNDLINHGGSTTAEKLKAIALKIQLLGIDRPKGTGAVLASEPAFDPEFNAAMADPIIRKKAAELAAQTQKKIERLKR